jgi:glycosyltransferase involved in cell wall biosynthesis
VSPSEPHVLYLIDSLHQGGAEQSLVDLAPHLIAAGVVLEIAVLKPGGLLEPAARRSGAGVTHVTETTSRRARFRSVAALLADRRPALVHTTLFESDLIGRMAAARHRIPVVSSVVNLAYGKEHRAAPGLRAHRVLLAQASDAATARVVRRFHTNSAALVAPMARRLLVPQRRFEVIPRGRDPLVLGTRTPERRQAVRLALGLGADQPVVLAAARHEHQKGLDVLVAAAAALRHDVPDLVVLVAGRDGNRTKALVDAIASAGLESTVRLLGPRTDVADLMVGADVFTLPSRWEGLPGAVIEAMALETPVVASNLPGVREVLGPLAASVVVEPGDVRALTAELRSALTDRTAAERFSVAARARFLRMFTTERIAREMLVFYERSIDGR